MFYNNPKFQEKYYKFVSRTEKVQSKIGILKVDFQKSWWDVVLQERKVLSLVILSEIFGSVFVVIFPIIIGIAFTTGNYNLLLVIVFMMFFDTWSHNIIEKLKNISIIKITNSVEFNANKFFLTVDPINHSTKSSGQIISKVSRGSIAFIAVSDLITEEVVSTFASLITVSVTMFIFDWVLGLLCFVFITIIGLFNIISYMARQKVFQPKRIKAEDELKAINVETLLQTPFIRAIFASNEQIQKVKSATNYSMIGVGNGWQSAVTINGISRSLHILSILAVGSIIFHQMTQGIFSPILAISMVLAYTGGTQNIVKIGLKVKNLTEYIANINDLFDFIRGFGKQTFPVLDNDWSDKTANELQKLSS